MASTPRKLPSAPVERKPKTVYQLDSPFTTVSWPDISPQNQETILELLCSILSPIGQHRTNHITPSKGKRSKKRKREGRKRGTESGTTSEETSSIPSPPEISSHLLVGLNSITRSLEALSQASKPVAAEGSHIESHDQPECDPVSVTNNSMPKGGNPDTLDIPTGTQQTLQSPLPPPHIAAIFVPSSHPQPTILQAHLPQLIFTASLAHPALPPTRLIQLPKNSDARLCDALGLPRVSFIGLLDGAPNSKALLEMVREMVPAVDVPWLREVAKKDYLKVKVNAIETFASVGAKEKKSA